SSKGSDFASSGGLSRALREFSSGRTRKKVSSSCRSTSYSEAWRCTWSARTSRPRRTFCMAIRWGLAKFKRQTVHQPSAPLSELAFRRALSLERKRAKRSRKLFVLMLVDVSTSTHAGENDNLLTRAASAHY